MRRFFCYVILLSFLTIQLHGLSHSADIDPDHNCTACEVQTNTPGTLAESLPNTILAPVPLAIIDTKSLPQPKEQSLPKRSPRAPPKV